MWHKAESPKNKVINELTTILLTEWIKKDKGYEVLRQVTCPPAYIYICGRACNLA